MNIKQVKYFIAVAQCKSLSAAAREQGVSVQAISKAMRDFEQELPAPLLVRRSDGIALTPFGEEFYPRALSVWNMFHELETMTTADAEQNRPVRVQLCSPAFWHSRRVQASLESFFSKYLGMDAEVAFGRGEEGLQALRAGTYDALITIGILDRPDFECFILGTVPTGVCVAKNHPLATYSEVTLKDIAPYPALSSKVFDHFNESILVTHIKAGLDMKLAEPDDAISLVDLFYRKHGMCFMAKIPALGEMLPGSVVVPFAEADDKTIPLCLISPRRAKTSGCIQLEKLLKDRSVTRAL